MDYVVFKAGGKQHRVSAGDVIEVNKIVGEKDQSLSFEEVLLLVNDGKVTLGKPYIAGAKVKVTVLEQKKGEKLRVAKFKAKARYRRTLGFRALLTAIRVDEFGVGSTKADKKVATPVKTASKAAKS